jgi:hypothetical protein
MNPLRPARSRLPGLIGDGDGDGDGDVNDRAGDFRRSRHP